MTNTLAYFDLPSAMLKTVFIIPRQSKEMTNTLAYFDFLNDEHSFYNTKTWYDCYENFFGHDALTNDKHPSLF